MDRKRQPGDNRPEIEDYRLVDLSITRKNIFKKWDFVLNAKNIFDSDAREPSPFGIPTTSIPDDLPLAGRSIFAELRYEL